MARPTGAAALLSLALALSACGGEPRIDASSERAARTSIERLAAKLPPEERHRFEAALKDIARVRAGATEALVYAQSFSLPDPEAGEAGGAPGAHVLAAVSRQFEAEWRRRRYPLLVERAGAALDGRTAEEVLALAAEEAHKADEAARALLERRLAEAREALAEAAAEPAPAAEIPEGDRAVLARLRVEDARLGTRPGKEGDDLVLSLTVENGTEAPVTRARVRVRPEGENGEGASEAVLDLAFPGGLMPGTRKRVIQVKPLSAEWAALAGGSAGGALLRVEAVGFEGPTGPPVGILDPADAARPGLEALTGAIRELEAKLGKAEEKG